MASEDLKRIVAREIAGGETIAEVARQCGYTWKGMNKLVKTAAVQQLIQAERQRLQTLHDQCRARLLQLGPEALDHIAEVLRTPSTRSASTPPGSPSRRSCRTAPRQR